MLAASRARLLNFCQTVDNNYVTEWFHEIIGDILQSVVDDVLAKKKRRIIITLPPRSGKTELTSIRFPAWALGNYPQLKFILSTYGADLSEKVGMKTRDLVQSKNYAAIFPKTHLRQDTKSKTYWMTDQGGHYYSVGVGGAVTGTGADIILCDDLVKNREEAESKTVQDKVWEYYRSTLYSRLEGAGAVIVIMQRWNNNDLVARLLEEEAECIKNGEEGEGWEVINFPAIAQENEYYKGQLVRKEGMPLWPSKFPLSVLENIRQVQGAYNWFAQYLQNPIHAENQEFREEMFVPYDEEDLQGKYLRYFTLIDPAISQKDSADNTVVLTVAKEVDGPNIYRIKEDAGHFTPKQLVDLVFKHQALYGSSVWLETVAFQKALKYAMEEEQKVRGQYFKINELKANNKEVRIRGLLPFYERGVIKHRRVGEGEYESEALQFPRGRRDDRLDAMSYIIHALEEQPSYKKVKQYYPHLNQKR